MAKIILDFGSGNSCKNNWDYTKRMIDELKAVDSGRHSVVIKWQLFLQAGDNIPLDRNIFQKAYYYAKSLGYKTTSSVFDKESLEFLLRYEPCFVKIANRRELDWLIGEIPRKVPVYVSTNNINIALDYSGNIICMACVSEYPASIDKYAMLQSIERAWAISDHTTDFALWHKYQPEIIEWHFGLPDSTGLDAGPFMRTPEMLREVL